MPAKILNIETYELYLKGLFVIMYAKKIPNSDIEIQVSTLLEMEIAPVITLSITDYRFSNCNEIYILKFSSQNSEKL